MNRGGHSIYEEIEKAGFNPSDYIRFYHLRTYDVSQTSNDRKLQHRAIY